jgi:hypothetical protein
LNSRPKSIHNTDFRRSTIALRPIVSTRLAANRVAGDRSLRRRTGGSMLTRLAHLIVRHRWAVIGAWLVLTLFGGFAAPKVSNRWLQSFSIPGHSAYEEASQRTVDRFGTGERPPNVVVFRTNGDATKSEAILAAMERAAKTSPAARTSSYFLTGSDADVSKDRHTTFGEHWRYRQVAQQVAA